MNLEQHEYLAYGKGPIVLHALQRHLGDDTYYRVLRSFIEKHQLGMQATLPDLVKHFAVNSPSPDEVHRLFNDSGLTPNAFIKRRSKE